jgi:hypothetical protein
MGVFTTLPYIYNSAVCTVHCTGHVPVNSVSLAFWQQQSDFCNCCTPTMTFDV